MSDFTLNSPYMKKFLSNKITSFKFDIFLQMNSQFELFQQTIKLWDKMWDTNWFEDQCDIETFLGVHYAKAAIEGDCTLTDTGLEIVKHSKKQMIELLSEYDEDFDESEFK